jgi:hypothetical protein
MWRGVSKDEVDGVLEIAGCPSIVGQFINVYQFVCQF